MNDTEKIETIGSLTTEQGSSHSTAMVDTWVNALVKHLASIPQVRHVLTEQIDGQWLVWIAVDDPGEQKKKDVV